MWGRFGEARGQRMGACVLRLPWPCPAQLFKGNPNIHMPRAGSTRITRFRPLNPRSGSQVPEICQGTPPPLGGSTPNTAVSHHSFWGAFRIINGVFWGVPTLVESRGGALGSLPW